MIFYYQTSDNQHAPWIQADAADYESIKTERAYHINTLLISHAPQHGEVEPPRYKGHLVFDIDCKGNIPEAKRQTINLIEGLTVPPEQLEIFATGGKGFHVVVHGAILGADKPTQYLPLHYRFIATQFKILSDVPDLDMSLYNEGKGKLIRVENKKRNNGAYKVPITYAELLAMDTDSYAAFCSKPRVRTWEIVPPTRNEKLRDMYLDAVTNVTMMQTQRAKAKPVTNDQLENVPCFDTLKSGRYGGDGQTNKGIQTFARLVVAKGISLDDDHVTAFCENNSTKGSKPKAIHYQLSAAVENLKGDSGFSCGYVRALNNFNTKLDCEGCPLYKTKSDKAESATPQKTTKKRLSNAKKAFENAEDGAAIEKAAIALAFAYSGLVPAKVSVDKAVSIVTDITKARGLDFESKAREIITGTVSKRSKKVASRNILSGSFKFDETLKVKATTDVEGSAEINHRLNMEVARATIENKNVLVADTRGKGAGKTNLLKVIKDLQTRLRGGEYHAGILYVAHRQSLISNAAERIGVADYQNFTSGVDYATEQQAVCINSLPKVKQSNLSLDWQAVCEISEQLQDDPDNAELLGRFEAIKYRIGESRYYQAVFIDEARQTYEHAIDSNTIKGRAYLLECLEILLKRSRLVVLADAELNDDALKFYHNLCSKSHTMLISESEVVEHSAKHHVLESLDAARQQILELSYAGRRVVVPCTAEGEADNTFKHLKDTLREDMRILLVTAANKGEAAQQRLLENPTKEMDNWDIVIFSPVISSGVSMEHPKFDATVMLNSCVLPENESVQALARNRCAKDVFVAFGKQNNFQYVTDVGVLVQGEIDKVKSIASDNGIECGEIKINKLGQMRCELIAKRNASMLDFANNFMLLCELQGRNFEYKSILHDELKGLSKAVKAEKAKSILGAKQIWQDEAQHLNDKAALTRDESNALERFNVIKMVGASDIAIEDVECYQNEGFSVVLNLETLQTDTEVLRKEDKANFETGDKLRSGVSRQKIFKGVLNALGDGEVTEKEALKACKFLAKHHAELAAEFGNFNKDKWERPIQDASRFIRKFGFKLEQVKQTSGGQRIYRVVQLEHFKTYVENRKALLLAQISWLNSRGLTPVEIAKNIGVSKFKIEKFLEHEKPLEASNDEGYREFYNPQ